MFRLLWSLSLQRIEEKKWLNSKAEIHLKGASFERCAQNGCSNNTFLFQYVQLFNLSFLKSKKTFFFLFLSLYKADAENYYSIYFNLFEREKKITLFISFLFWIFSRYFHIWSKTLSYNNQCSFDTNIPYLAKWKEWKKKLNKSVTSSFNRRTFKSNFFLIR